MKKIILLLLLIVASTVSFATHNRAGFITVKPIAGSGCLCDSIIIVTYTKTDAPAVRLSLPVNFGDNTSDTAVPRIISYGLNSQFYPNVTFNTYATVHCYPGPGTYTVTMEDPNRNAGVINIPNSVNIPIFFETTFTIDPILGCDNSPIVLNSPIDVGCVGEPYIYNPNAYDPDGDSLSYVLVPCRGAGGANIVGFFEPMGTPTFTLDPITGDLKWINPRFSSSNPHDTGEWNVAILILEWRRDLSGNYQNIGNVTLDMQITISNCHNDPPVIAPIPDTCVLAGSNVRLHVSATDPDGDGIVLSATGGPFWLSNPASFRDYSGPGTVSENFNWLTDCDDIRRLPYSVTFKAIDDDASSFIKIPLTDLKTVNITVIAPAPKNLVATPSGNTINLHWNPETCPNAIGYKVYRRNSFYTDSIECPCTVGVPSSTGFSFIAFVSGIMDTTFADDNNGLGLDHGVKYCYFVTAIFADSSESCASNQACAQLIKDSPIITNVSIDSTKSINGQIYVAWSKPSQLDTNIAYPGPYQYKIYRSNGFVGATLVYIDTTNTDTILSLTDTIFVDTMNRPLNTLDSAWSYRVDLYSNGTLVNKSSIASSIYLSITGLDHTLNLSWSQHVGWTDTLYKIYRKNLVTLAWDSIGKSTTTTYADTGLAYGIPRCYYVKSVGYYSGSGYVYPIVNLSEQQCATPVDNIPPCSPDSTTVNADCRAHEDFITWNNPNNTCANYVSGYKIYYSPTSKSDYELLATLTNPTDTFYLYSNPNSIAGCFLVTSIDSGNLESRNPIKVCVDNCPEYSLPNVFTPNGDNINDLFHPFPYSYVKDVDIKIFDRWGILMYKTTNPDINWDGKDASSKGDCPDGVYYYICKVNTIHYDGIRTFTLKGFIELIREKK